MMIGLNFQNQMMTGLNFQNQMIMTGLRFLESDDDWSELSESDGD